MASPQSDALSAPFPELSEAKPVFNLSTPALLERSLARNEGHLTADGALVSATGEFTGRAPQHRYIVQDNLTRDTVAWGATNRPITPEVFENVRRRVAAYTKGRDVFVKDVYAGSDPAYRLRVRVVTEYAWHSLFANQLFLRPRREELKNFQPDFTVVDMPGCLAEPDKDGTAGKTYILVNLERRLILIGGTQYAGEIKKSIFSVLNFLLPGRDVLPMHCSANVGAANDTALFFGLSGTGKTTLSADPNRRLIGDDEHGWGAGGVFNFEGGCYAKCIKLSREGEPQIWNAIRYGTVLENVVIDPATGVPNYDDDSRTENTRAAYPIDFIDNAIAEGRGPHPRNVVFLTADAFGVLPPLAQLSTPQAMYQFLSGYTAKLGGTEAGVKEPKATFSTCFGEPFLPLPPQTYARMLGERVEKHKARCWLVNTGWTGGAYGVGQRMKLSYTRAMVNAVLSGALDEVAFRNDPIFGLALPASVAGVPTELLDPSGTWKDRTAYETAAKALAQRFRDNFQRFGAVAPEIAAAGPKG